MARLSAFLMLLFASCSTSHAPSCKAFGADAMVWVPGGAFRMGEAARLPEEGPTRLVSVPGFWMSAHEVTNAEFAAFVAATGYKTVAERPPPPVEGAPPEMLKPGSAIFALPSPGQPQWWRWGVGAHWRDPEGKGAGIKGHDTEPVVQIAYEDAEAYARWKGLALPDEAQWEFAARADAPGSETMVETSEQPLANTWQGRFPDSDKGGDGYKGRAPVGCFAPNRFGFYDMIGNVWEWTRSADPRAPGARVIKGGSFLCAANYCARYRPSARQFQELGLGTDHIGFRVIDPKRPPPA